MNRFAKRIVTGLVVFASTLSFGMDVSQKLQLQEMVERRLLPVVKNLDSEASVFVHLEPKKEDSDLSANPLLLQAEGLGVQETYKFSKFQVVIVSRLEELPASARVLIKKLTKDFNVSPQIVMEPLSTTQTEYSERTSTKVEIEGFEKAQEGFVSMGQLVFAAMGLIAFVLCVVGAIGVISFRQSNDSGKTQTTSLKNESKRAMNEWMGYSDESFTALLSDCYWCQEDAYASFVWNRIPVSQKRSVVGGTTFLRQYVENLTEKKESDLKLLDHPYYLAPLAVNHMDNHALTEMVKKHPGLLAKVSPMRGQFLTLTAVDKVRLELVAESKDSSLLPDPKTFPAGKERMFPRKSMIVLSSVDEEATLVRMKGISTELKSRIPSLAWLAELSDKKRTEILESLTNEELAMAWVGPKEVLERLKNSLSVERRAELSVWLSRVTPNRESAGFRKLHALAVNQLKNESIRNDGNSQRKAA